MKFYNINSEILVFTFFLLVMGFLLSCSNEQSAQKTTSVAQSLSGGDITGFKRAVDKREFKFPDDFGPHFDYQTEWWYYTGNLTDSAGRDFGYQLTIFRRSLSPEEQERESKWASNQIYFAHFALTDIENNKFYSSERWSRDSMKLAGAQSNPFRVWIDNWSIEKKGETFLLKASDNKVSIDLLLEPIKPIVLQGNNGLSQKSEESGNASYYFSQTSLDTSGMVSIDGQEFNVRGLSWLDREWSTSALSENQQGWDWFSLQLDDGREIMLYQLRLKDGGIDPYSSGTIINKNGTYLSLRASDFSIDVLDKWKSPDTGKVYPSKWGISIPAHNIELTLSPAINNQELLLSFIYWEGAVKVTGNGISGKGYVELTGY